MSDTATDGSSAQLLDGAQDRVGGAQPMLPDLPQSSAFGDRDIATLPVVSHVMTDGSAPSIPTLPSPTTPSLPTPSLPTLPNPTLPNPTVATASAGAPAELADPPSSVSGTPAVEPRHPMAHLMPGKNVPSEASLRAAELRAAKKAKSRKIKIGVTIGALAFAALVGPPLGTWLVDAINEAGSTAPDQPAPTVAPGD